MSFVTDQIRRIDNQLDRLQLATSSGASVPSSSSSPELQERSLSTEEQGSAERSQPAGTNLARVGQLQSTIRALSTASSSNPLLSSRRLLWLLENIDLSPASSATAPSSVEKELEWLLVSKATVQAYGLILDLFLGQIIPLNNDIWYWDDILGSYFYSGLYMLQTSPLRVWGYSKEIYGDAIKRLNSLRRIEGLEANEQSSQKVPESMSARWQQFYGLVRQAVQERSISDLQSKMLTPVTRARLEARRKQRSLKKLREMSASGLGVLMDEGLSFDADDGDSDISKQEEPNEEWKSIVAKSVSLMETVLRNVTTLDTSVHDFEDVVFANVENDADNEEIMNSQPAVLSTKLRQILTIHIPEHAANSRRLVNIYGKPSRLIRYWPAAMLLFFSSSTLLRIFFRRKQEILQWIRDLGATSRDFWFNWIVEPVKKVIGTIRHDKDSEIAIMSKESLKGDRDSLERMVVEFAVDNPESGVKLTDTEIADIRSKVKEGDLTPVLKAYEKDLRSPFMGTIRGNLVRALLIQTQKTKVDVEVAIGGIDALLKSQELVFGFVGLTPGIFVCLGLGRWFATTFGGRQGRSKGIRRTRMVRVLRNVDRILTSCTPSSNGMLSYKEHGLLLCEVHVLRQNGQYVLPSEINREFLEEINDLVDIRTGVDRQLKVVERIRWAYWKWLQ